jgi:hypothetical protein
MNFVTNTDITISGIKKIVEINEVKDHKNLFIKTTNLLIW